jgi:hypothetical protein
MSSAQTTRSAVTAHSEPTGTALERARAASRRARATAQLRIGFISRQDPNAPPPPLAKMLRGGRGGQVRLKLLLSLLWFQTDGTQAVPLAYPSQVWAELLDLHNPKDAGARRINEAQRWLENHGFITIEARPGRPNRVTVLNETGNGAPYEPPGRAANLMRNTDKVSSHYYVQVPHEVWTSGYMSMLSGPGVALFLILLDQYGPGRITDPHPVWFSPTVLRDRYALSDDTRNKGMNDMRDLGLITVKRQPFNPGDFDIRRIRNTYALDLGALSHGARRTTDDPDAVFPGLTGSG